MPELQTLPAVPTVPTVPTLTTVPTVPAVPTNMSKDFINNVMKNKKTSIGIIIGIIGIIIVGIIILIIIFKFKDKLKIGSSISIKPSVPIEGYDIINNMGDLDPFYASSGLLKGKTPEECSSLCNNNNNCEVFTYDKKNKSCMLRQGVYKMNFDKSLDTYSKINKNSKIEKDPNNLFKSYSGKKQTDKNVSNWISNTEGTAKAHCMDACSKLNNCRGVLEHIGTGNCILQGRVDVEHMPSDPETIMHVKQEKVKGYDEFYGMDTNVTAYSEIQAHNVSKCAEACDADEACEGFSQQFGLGRCWLKNDGMYKMGAFIGDTTDTYMFRKSKNTPTIWKPVINETTELSEPKFQSISLNINDCKNLCEDSEGCDGFNYIKSTKVCQFKTNSGQNTNVNTDIDYYQIKKEVE
jgi:hypothetical protein